MYSAKSSKCLLHVISVVLVKASPGGREPDLLFADLSGRNDVCIFLNTAIYSCSFFFFSL